MHQLVNPQKPMKAREIILLRHAQANTAMPGQPDVDRHLTEHGQTEADGVGQWLTAQKALIDLILCSPARRTQQTAECVLRSLGEVPILTDRRIYNAAPTDLLDVLNEYLDKQRLLLIGHNPGMEVLTALLTTGQASDYRGMPPAGLAWLELSSGIALEPGVARLKHFWSPG